MYEKLWLSQERAVRPAPYAIPVYIGVGAGNTLQAGSSGGLAIGEYLISRIEMCQLMILIPYRLRSQSKIVAVAVTDCQIVSGTALSAADTLKFLSINNSFSALILSPFLIPEASAPGLFLLPTGCFVSRSDSSYEAPS